MEEVIVEGLNPKDFIVLEQILRTYKVSLDSNILYADIVELHNKIKQIIDYLEE